MTEPNRFRTSLGDLEAGVRVPRDRQVAEEPVQPGAPEYVAPEDLERLRLLADPAGAGTLRPRR